MTNQHRMKLRALALMLAVCILPWNAFAVELDLNDGSISISDGSYTQGSTTEANESNEYVITQTDSALRPVTL